VLDLMPSSYQRRSLEVLLSLFLKATGKPLPAYSELKSGSALSRFLNHYRWPVRQVIRTLRQAALKRLLAPRRRGRRPILEVVVDLTCLEKAGRFKGLNELIHVLNGKRGLHVVILYVCVDGWRIPWGFRVWRGKSQTSPSELALRLLHTLPKEMRRLYRIRVLAEGAFGGTEFIPGVRRWGFHAVTGICRDRRLQDGRRVDQVRQRGECIQLSDRDEPVFLSWVWLKRQGQWVQRFVISTQKMTGRTIARCGKRRWRIEGFFKTAKHRFGLHRFGQKTRQGVYRWLILSFMAFLLAHWCHEAAIGTPQPDWAMAAQQALETLLPALLLAQLLLDIDRLDTLAQRQGIHISVSRCNI
jgi:hypothetical protein